MPSGTMLRWNSEKGFGFIQPSVGGEDVFCHVSDLMEGEGSVQEGDDVRYTEKYDDRKGKVRAAEVELLPGGAHGGVRESREDTGGRDRDRGGGGGGRDSGKGAGEPGTGTMLRWQSDKGFGFVKPDDGDEDLFVHVSSLLDGDGSVQDGDKVTFVKEFNDRKNKYAAVNVKSTGGGGGSRRSGGGGGGGRDRGDDRDRRRDDRDRDRDHDRRGDRDRDRRDRDRDRGGDDDRRRDRDRDDDRRRDRSDRGDDDRGDRFRGRD